MFNIKKVLVLTFALALTMGVSFADDAVFSGNNSSQEINLKPVSSTPAPVQTQAVDVNTTNSPSLSSEKFKSAVNNLDSAQVDIREQLASCKTLLEQKEAEVTVKKSELSALKKEYRALQRKMKNVDKMKKMLNENI